MLTVLVIAAVCGALIVSVPLAMLFYRKVGPNQVLIISGRRGAYVDPATGESIQKSFRIYHGGGTFVVPLREKVDVMSVELMTLELRTPEFFTKFGVPIVVDAIAQIKVRSDDPLAVATAAEMFLSKTKEEMNEIAHQMMQGHLRAVISTMPFEEIHANPEAFAQTVQRLTAADLANMGVQVVSFTIREVRDPSGFLQALGRPQLAEVQKNASVGEANAARDATVGRAEADQEAAIRSARARQAAKLAEIEAETAVADAESMKECRVHELSSQVAESKAARDRAYELATLRAKEAVIEEELRLAELTLAAKEKELSATVQKPAEAERRRIETLAEAERARARIEADAAADGARLRGEAEAEVVRARGAAEAERVRMLALAEAEGMQAKLTAEAEGMRLKAEAWQQYSSAALGQLALEKLPEIARAVAEPLGNVERIVLVGNGGSSGVEKVTRGVTDVIAQLPGLVETLSGVDLRGLMQQITPQAKDDAGPAPLERVS